jgi:hypothetical protein
MDEIIFPNEFFATYYKTLSDKNRYLGTPKYDVVLDRQQIIEKYELKDEKYALIAFPRYRDLKQVDLHKLYEFLEKMGYSILLKTRGKEPVPRELRKGRYFEDGEWYPHVTMELIEASDIVVNFDSATIIECIMANTPLINFNIKPFVPVDFLYNSGYCQQLKPKVSYEAFKDAVEFLTTADLTSDFDGIRQKYLFEPGRVSQTILDEVGL